MLNHVKSHGLGQRAALADGHNISLADVKEGGRAVYGHVGVLLAKTSVLGDILQVITAHNHGSLHFVGDNHSFQDTTTNRYISGEGALLVNI